MAAKRKFRETAQDAEEGGEGMSSLLTVSLSSKRIARVYEFKGMMLCDIREVWFDAAGNAKPGKKGISLTLDQVQKLFAEKDEILALMEKASAAADGGKSPAKRRKTNASAGEDDGEGEGEEGATAAAAAVAAAATGGGASSSSGEGKDAKAGAGTA